MFLFHRMSDLTQLYIDKYKPDNLDDLDYNFDLNKQLKNLAKIDDLPHLIFQGTSGSGKKTRAFLYLREKFGQAVTKIKSHTVTFKYQSKIIEMQMLYSGYHYQINPSLYGVYDKFIIQDFIKNVANVFTRTLADIPYRIIIIEDADKLSYEAQQSLRRTLEKYINVCRFIFIVTEVGNMISALQSRCIKLRVSAPSKQTVKDILKNISLKENIIDITEEALDSICIYSNQDLSKAINSLQLIVVKSPDSLNSKEGIKLSEFKEVEAHISNIIKILFTGRNVDSILTLRKKVYDLLIYCIDPLIIIRSIFQHIMRNISDDYFKYKYQIIKIASYYDNTLRLGSKPIYHLEGYLIDLFKIVKNMHKEIAENSSIKTVKTTKSKNTKKIMKCN